MNIVPAEFDVSYSSKNTKNFSEKIVLGRVTRDVTNITKDSIFFSSGFCADEVGKLASSSVVGVITNDESVYGLYAQSVAKFPIFFIETNDVIEDGCVVSLTGRGRLRILFRPSSNNNALFVTDACNNYCLMCPQPPRPLLDLDVVEHLLRIVELIDPASNPFSIGITGGEPTMIKDGLIVIIKAIRLKFPNTRIELLTNGRFLSYQQYTYELSAAAGKNTLVCIPLFGHVSSIHDYIVQAQGGFDQALDGIIECHRNGLNVEIRIVLHRLTIENLLELSEFIVRNLMFVSHVAFMGMESQGFAKKNWDLLYIDPLDYQDVLLKSVKLLEFSGVHASLYNLPHCVVPSSIRNYCRASISDFKNIFLDTCSDCIKRNECAGLFASNINKYRISEKIAPITHDI
ncbi:His-Xaa-Ser system radical SAM maturase HxsC [Aeromonas caviae]